MNKNLLTALKKHFPSLPISMLLKYVFGIINFASFPFLYITINWICNYIRLYAFFHINILKWIKFQIWNIIKNNNIYNNKANNKKNENERINKEVNIDDNLKDFELDNEKSENDNNL